MTKDEALYGYEDSDPEDDDRGRRGGRVSGEEGRKEGVSCLSMNRSPVHPTPHSPLFSSFQSNHTAQPSREGQGRTSSRSRFCQ